MPEGDTIFRAARTLHRALAGKPVVRFESVFPALTRVHVDTPLTGQTVESVSASGKHLLIRFSGGLILRTHMRMNGSWHIYRPHETWQRPRRDMRIVVATADFVAVGFNIPVAEFFPARDLARHEELRRLGPDLLSEDFDEEEALRRIQGRPAETIADVLLNQRVVAGIGNVYKSEVLFACRINPFVRAGDLDVEALSGLLATARRLLLANVHSSLASMTTYTGYRRTTGRDNPGERLWVYGRAGQPCRRCGAPVKIDKRGTDARLTYWCPACQSASPTTAGRTER
jgi:endonuclease VIII